MKLHTVARTAIGLAALVTAAAAPALVVEPDDFAPGTDISNAVPGVTLSASGNIVTDTSVFATTPPTGPGVSSTGSLVFGYQNVNQQQTSFQEGFLTSRFRADFDALQASVSIDAIGNNTPSGGSDSAILRAFDAGNTLLASDTVSGLSRGQVGTLTVNFASGISYITVRGGTNAGVNLDNLRTTAVPEPTTAGLLIASTLGLLGRRRRSR